MIDVAFTPAEARQARTTVVIDVLRATSTILAALDAGYQRVLCAPRIEHALAIAGHGRTLAGERHCVRPVGFDVGNSPAEVRAAPGTELVLSTTNGAPAIVRAAELSDVVLIGALLNLDALVDELAGHDDVQLLCAGTDGRPALEDVYAAGRIAARLPGERSDAALTCIAAASSYACARDALAAGADARVLVAAGLEEDIDACALESTIAAVPRLVLLRRRFAVVASGKPIDIPLMVGSEI
jgi:2-phosphosulfolactate phosphatase